MIDIMTCVFCAKKMLIINYGDDTDRICKKCMPDFINSMEGAADMVIEFMEKDMKK